VATLVLAGGCSQPARESDGTNSKASQTLRIAYPGISTTIWPLMYARDTGILEAEGLDLEMLRIRGVPQIIATLMSGDIDVAWVGFDGMASAVVQGAGKLRYIGEFLIEFPTYLVVTPDIESIEDLRGKAVATAGAGSMTEALFLEGLRQGGLSDPRKDTQFMNMHGSDNRLTQMINGTFVGIALSPPWAQQAEAQGYKILQYQGDILNPYAGEGPITHTRVIESNRRGLQGLVNSLRAAIRGMGENREEAVKIAVEYMALDPALAEKAYDVMMPVMRTEGMWNLEGIQRAFDSKTGPDNKVNASDFLDDSFL
jgi:ABC-type nitrate/sulfonate/bicarbonate transport system substrate-binding protein